MADINNLIPFILKWEGGFSNHPSDPGGATMKGVTLATFRMAFGKQKSIDDLKRMTDDEWRYIFRTFYWNRWQGDKIRCQRVANILIDWVWASGSHGITKVQKLLKVVPDGIAGEKTLNALNHRDCRELFDEIFRERERFIRSLRNFPIFGRGWLRRLYDIKNSAECG